MNGFWQGVLFALGVVIDSNSLDSIKDLESSTKAKYILDSKRVESNGVLDRNNQRLESRLLQDLDSKKSMPQITQKIEEKQKLAEAKRYALKCGIE